jgi:heterodisulfide reductase subunit B
MNGQADIITGTAHAVEAGTWPWIVGGLALAVVYMAWHFVKRHEQDRTDRKEEREALLKVVRETGEVVKDNTRAMTELKGVVSSVQRTLDIYTRQEH